MGLRKSRELGSTGAEESLSVMLVGEGAIRVGKSARGSFGEVRKTTGWGGVGGGGGVEMTTVFLQDV